MRIAISYLLVFLLIFVSGSAVAETLAVKSQSLNLRSGPGEKYSVKCVYSQGFPLKVMKRKGEWVQVSDFENEVGWVSKQLLTTTPHAIVAVYRGKKNKINIRSGPGTKYNVVGQAYYGVVFTVLERKGLWRKIRHGSGLSGWVQQNLLWGT